MRLILLLLILRTMSFAGELEAFEATDRVRYKSFAFVETTIGAETHHANQRFLAASSSLRSILDMLPQEHRTKALLSKVERATVIERSELDRLEQVFTSIGREMKNGGVLYIFRFKDSAVFEQGYVIIRDGKIVRKWLEDWAEILTDGSMRTTHKKERAVKQSGSA